MNIISNHSVQCTSYMSSYSSLISSKNITMEKKCLIHNHFHKLSIIEFQSTVPSVQTLSQTANIIFVAQISVLLNQSTQNLLTLIVNVTFSLQYVIEVQFIQCKLILQICCCIQTQHSIMHYKNQPFIAHFHTT